MFFCRFEHIYRHHRELGLSCPNRSCLLTLPGRYRITEGSEEIQQRKIAAYIFGYVGPRKAELSKL